MSKKGLHPTEIVIICLTIVIVIVALAVYLDFSVDGAITATQPPRPTLPLITVTCEVFLPIIEKHGPTPQVTPRPTLEGK